MPTTARVVVVPQEPGPLSVEQVTLPDGATASAFTIGTDWFAVVTEDDQILIFDQVTGTLRQTVTLTQD